MNAIEVKFKCIEAALDYYKYCTDASVDVPAGEDVLRLAAMFESYVYGK